MIIEALVPQDKFYGIAWSHSRGHLILWDNFGQRWIFASDSSEIAKERPCVKCGRMPTPEGYDACLGYVPGVISACCGHGVSDPILLWR